MFSHINKMLGKIVIVLNIVSCVLVFVAMFISIFEAGSSQTYSDLLGDITRSLRNDFIHNISVSGEKCSNDESPIILGFWPGTVVGCNCTSVNDSNIEPSRRNRLNRDKCTYNETKAGCENVEPIKSKDYTYWRSTQFCSKKSKETNNEWKYFDYLENSVKKGESCLEGYKKCGILDTLNNTLCLLKNETCPLNLLIVTNSYLPPPEYQNLNVTTVLLEDNIEDEYYLHYSNEAINNSVIVDFQITEPDKLCIESNHYYSSYYYPLNGITANCSTSLYGVEYSTRYSYVDTVTKEQLFIDHSIYSQVDFLPDYETWRLEMIPQSLYTRPYLGFTKKAMSAVKSTPENNEHLSKSGSYFTIITILLLVSFLFIVAFVIADGNEIEGVYKVLVLLAKAGFLVMAGFIYSSFENGREYIEKIILPEHDTSDIFVDDRFDYLRDSIDGTKDTMLAIIVIYSIALALFIVKTIINCKHYTGINLKVPLLGKSYEMSNL